MNADFFSEDYIPGTTNILVSQNDVSSQTSETVLQRNKKGIILLPQPSQSPNDPLNWSVSRKIWHLFLMAFLTGLTAAVANDAGSAEDSLTKIKGVSYETMNTGAGVLFIFIGWSCMLFAPASSLYGRRITYLLCLLAGILGSIWFGSSKTPADTIWSQAFVGMSEACAEAQVQQSLADVFFQHQLGSVLTIYILAMSIGSFLGPLVAQFISQTQGFRWIGWWGAILMGATLIVFFFGCEETVFDRNRHSAIYELEDQDQPTSQVEKLPLNQAGSSIAVEKSNNFAVEAVDPESKLTQEKLTPYSKRIAIITPAWFLKGFGFKQYLKRFIVFFKVFTLPGVWLSGLLWGMQDTFMSFYLTTQDNVFYEEPWNYSENRVALMNIATLVGAVFGCFFSGILSDKHVLWLAKKNDGRYEPEYRLWLLFATLFISPIGLIMFGVGSEKGGDWPTWVIYGGLVFVGFGFGSVGDTSLSYLMDAYPEIIIQGMVGVSIINNSLACIFTFTCSKWLDSAGTTNTYIVLAVIDFVTIGCIIPTLIWGKSWRKMTKNLYIELVELTQGTD